MSGLAQSGARVIVFAKAPVAGAAKTRLIPALGAQGAAHLAQRMLQHTLAQARAANCGALELCATPDQDATAWRTGELPSNLAWSAQGEGNLGQRMARAFQRSIEQHGRVVLMGTDCPELSAQHIAQAVHALDTHDAAMIPVADGGYILLALTRFDASLFENMPWSTPAVATITLERMAALGWTTRVFAPLHDIDEPADLQWLPPHWVQASPANTDADTHATQTHTI
jgi:uncharacterized protein